MAQFLKHLFRSAIPQSEMASTRQVKNSAGGFSFELDAFSRLSRFLILGTDGGSYHATERALTLDNTDVVKACLATDPARTIGLIVEISHSGRAPKNDPAIAALAIGASHREPRVRKLALDHLGDVCRTGTHLFTFVTLVNGLRGWGRGLKRAIGRWYTEKSEGDLAYQLAKYQARGGMSHRDVLRLAHPVAVNAATNAVLRWAVSGPEKLGERAIVRKSQAAGVVYPAAAALPRLLEGFAKVRDSNLSAKEVVALIGEYGLTHEMVPSEHLVHPAVWAALLPGMPLHAMVRNLARMTANGLLGKDAGSRKLIVDRLGDRDRIQKSRFHPLAILIAQRTYAAGHGLKGKLAWTPVSPIVDALDGAFDLAFANVVPTGKPTLLALDVSGSMSMGQVAGSPLTPREAAAAMALVTARTEPDYEIMAFGSSFVPLRVSSAMRLSDVVQKTGELGMSGTDCALPMTWASKEKRPFDLFAVYTDSETWFGQIHPHQALVEYRRTMGRASKLAVVGLVANRFTIADPEDAGMLDVVGFDAAAPQVIADFARS